MQNLTFIGFVPHAEIEAHFDGARMFVNTSEFEGFPNTFLQSWARGMPTVSFVDTGSMIKGEKVINQVHSFDEMVQTVDLLIKNDRSWEEDGQRCKQCFSEEHALNTVTKKYAELFYELFDVEK